MLLYCSVVLGYAVESKTLFLFECGHNVIAIRIGTPSIVYCIRNVLNAHRATDLCSTPTCIEFDSIWGRTDLYNLFKAYNNGI